MNSTGPRTAAGKSRVRRNAVTHGLYAKPAILPTEDKTQCDRFLDDLRQQLQPDGPLEAVVVDQIASILFQLQRLSRGYDIHVKAVVARWVVA
jgi:hypothetical protein